MQCISCDSNDLKKLGMRFNGVNKGLGYNCNECGETFVIPKEDSAEITDTPINDDVHYIRDDDYISKLSSAKKLVFTTALNNSDVDEVFFNSLLQYCNKNNAELVVFPIKYRNPSMINSAETLNCEYDAIV